MIKETKFYLLFVLALMSSVAVAMPLKGNQGASAESQNTDINVSSSSSFSVCYNEKSDVQLYINLRNSGLDTISNLQLGWFFTADQTDTLNWNGSLTAGENQNVFLDSLNLPAAGDFTITIWANAGNGDINPSNDTISISIHVFDPFVVNDLVDTTICKGASVNLNLPTNYVSYEWPDGSTSNNYTVNKDGIITVKVTDDNGCQSIDSMLIDYYDLQSPLLPGDTILCDGAIFPLAVDPNFVTVNWSDGTVGNSINIDTSGSYVAVATDTLGCTFTDTLMAMYVAVPTAGTPNNVYLCDGDSVTVTADSLFNSYNWSTGQTGSSIVISTPGSYVVTVVGPSGCVGVDTMQVTARPLPIVDFTDSVICNGDPIMLEGGFFDAYQWSTGSASQAIYVSSPGQYKVTVTDQYGCESSDSIIVLTKSVSVNLGNDTTVCVGDPVLIYLTGYDAYSWNDGDTNGIKWLGGAGTYAITVTNDGCSGFDIITVTEEMHPVANFNQQVTSPDVQFNNMSNINSGFLWNFGDGGTSVQNSPMYTYSLPGTYQVVLSVTNSCGVDSLVREITVFPQANNNLYMTNKLQIFPTLADEYINFTLAEIGSTDIEFMLFDVTGKLLIQKKEQYYNPDNVYQVDISSFASGTYYLRILSEDSFVATQPFIKK